MKKGMEESYIEDLANRGGPVHALATREGAAKRWIRGARRPALQPRNRQYRGADVLWISGRQHRWRRFSRAVSGPRGVGEPVHARDLFMLRTGRSHGYPPSVMVERVVRGRPRP
jgi:hypothetical protein